MKKVIEINNGRKLELEFTEVGIHINTLTENGETERADYIDDGEFVMLFNLFQAMWQNSEKSAYILNDFSRETLKRTSAIDFVEEFQIIN